MGHGLKDCLTGRGNREKRQESELFYGNWFRAALRATKISSMELPSFSLQTPPKTPTSRGGENTNVTTRQSVHRKDIEWTALTA